MVSDKVEIDIFFTVRKIGLSDIAVVLTNTGCTVTPLGAYYMLAVPYIASRSL